MTAPEKLLHELIALPSVNPALLPPHDPRAGERRVAEFLAATAASAGLDVELRPVFPERPNLLARLTPSGRTRQRYRRWRWWNLRRERQPLYHTGRPPGGAELLRPDKVVGLNRSLAYKVAKISLRDRAFALSVLRVVPKHDAPVLLSPRNYRIPTSNRPPD